MKRFKNIIFVNDPISVNNEALKKAIDLAYKNKAKLSIVNVLKELPHYFSRYKKEVIQTQHDQLNALVEDNINNLNIEIKTEILIGSAFLEIIKTVIKYNHDLLIKPVANPGGVSEAIFGSTDLHLLRKCPCPVWLLKATKAQKITRILAAVNPSPEEKNNAELNHLILELSISVARTEHCELHIVHAWEMQNEFLLRSHHVSISDHEIDKMINEIYLQHKNQFYELLNHYDYKGITVKNFLPKGTPGNVIPAVAKKENADIIVMGTVARTGISGFFMGNSAERILSNIDCSILAVKPASFVTPVEPD